MEVVTVTMDIRPEKRREMLITLQELTERMRKEPGFVDARIRMNGKQRNALTFVEEWDTQDAVNAYMQSEYFSILKGALQVLTTSALITLSNGCTVYDRRPP